MFWSWLGLFFRTSFPGSNEITGILKILLLLYLLLVFILAALLLIKLYLYCQIKWARNQPLALRPSSIDITTSSWPTASCFYWIPLFALIRICWSRGKGYARSLAVPLIRGPGPGLFLTGLLFSSAHVDLVTLYLLD